jgi:hypothetical protein
MPRGTNGRRRCLEWPETGSPIVSAITVVAADTSLGAAIARAARHRGHDVRALVGTIEPIADLDDLRDVTILGDLLDSAMPDHLIGDADVLVVPFGAGDRDDIEFLTDLQIAAVLGRLSTEPAIPLVPLVLVARAPATAIATSSPLSALRRQATLLAERATLVAYAMHTAFPWIYTAAETTLDDELVRAEPTRLLDDASTSELACATYPLSLAEYADDVVIRVADVARRRAERGTAQHGHPC